VVCRSQKYPLVQIQQYTGERVEGEQIVEFRLLYSGQLLGASRNDTRASLKHEIRREFHPQLRRLWASNDSLKDMARYMCNYWWPKHPSDEEELRRQGYSEQNPKAWTDAEIQHFGLCHLAEEWERFGCGFIPLITEKMCIRCALDILFLRPEEPGMLVHGGDLDNRVKTVFDALRLPKSLDELAGQKPQSDENPMYCLLEDDKLISEIRVVTDHLLLLPRERLTGANDVFLVIHVKLEPPAKNEWSWVFR